MTAGVSTRERLAVIVITDPMATGGPISMAKAALRAGAKAIQIRWKRGSTREIVELARALRGPTREAGAWLIVNDRIDIALATGADGAHLGDDDLPLAEARRLVPAGFILGRSVDTAAEAEEAEAAGADYVGFGPIHTTATKMDTGPVVGESMLSAVRRRITLPLIAIGGIQSTNAAAAIAAGADGVAVVTAISAASDHQEATARLLSEVRRALRLRE